MVGEINNLDKLLDKIYSEGLEKAQAESANLLAKTKKDCEALKKEAQEEAHAIITNAKRESASLTKSAENELQLKGKQLINDLKGEIENLLSNAILESNVSAAFADVSFLQAVIQEAVGHWKSTDTLELTLPKSLETKIEKSFTRSIEKHIAGLEVDFSDKMKGGFRISRSGDTYQVSFTEEDFIHLLRSYLTVQTDRLLFAGAS